MGYIRSGGRIKWWRLREPCNMFTNEEENDKKIKTAVEVATRSPAVGTAEETIEDQFTVGFDEHNEEIEKPIRKVVEETSYKTVKQRRVDIIWRPTWTNSPKNLFYGHPDATNHREYVQSHAIRSLCLETC